MLRILAIIALILPLSVDTLAVSASVGLAKIPPSVRWRVSLAMTAFETGMPLAGLAAGAGVAAGIGHWSRYCAAAVLVGAGLFFIWESLREDDGISLTGGVSWPALAALGLSVSMDELAIGFAGGLSRLPIIVLAVLLGIQALIASQIGLRFGGLLSEKYTEVAKRVGGVVLIAAAGLLAFGAL